MIEQMTHVAIMAKVGDRDALLRWLYSERGFHVMPIDATEDAAWQGKFAALPDQTQEIDNTLTRITAVVSFCTEHASQKPSFLDAMLPLKVVGTKAELDAALNEVDVDTLYDKTAAMRATIEKDNEIIARLTNDKTAIQQFAFLGDNLPALSRLKHVALDVVAVSGQGGKAFLMDERIASGEVVAEQLFADQTHAYYALLVPAADAAVLKGLIDDHGLHVQPIPRVDRGAAAEIADLDRRINENKVSLEQHLEEASSFADDWQKKTALVAGYYESEKILAVARTGMAESDHLFVTRGYVKTDDLQAMTSRMESALPGATLMACDAPATDAEQPEEPPVSLKWNKWISPASLLVKMYGLPAYNSIDPTPYVFTIFFAFVGICLGDAAYGIALIGIMLWLKRKYQDQAGLQDFFTCFLYCGIATVIAGTLTGSWMGDLSSMVPGLGWFDRFRTSMALIDPVKDSQLALCIAIGIGVATQFYGMILRAYRDWRRGDKMGAFSDGILWIAFLLFALLGGLTGGSIFWILFVITCVLLILTQGRDQKSWISRILVGIIAIYGIVGAYGASAILGDLISYARLMALNLTGAALGSTFNMLARLSTDIPYIGVIIGILVIVGGHLMNFFLNLLSGFVHSARLIMLEFFGRFYEAGGTAYTPYGFHSTSVDVTNEGQSR
ncbi:MAG: hypothetical protein LUE17_01340 [Planctomycetaceae bacterium]|nr:hypothetical protein [Planctomycetaceae bacterium]